MVLLNFDHFPLLADVVFERVFHARLRQRLYLKDGRGFLLLLIILLLNLSIERF